MTLLDISCYYCFSGSDFIADELILIILCFGILISCETANPPPSLPPGQIPLFAGPIQTNAGPRMVGTQPILHPTYMASAGPVPILPPSSFIAPPTVLGYGPPMTSPTGPNFVPIRFAGVPMPEVGSNPLEVRGGTVYFSPEAQKPVTDQRGGTIYFDPGQQAAASGMRSPARRPKAAIPIVNPEVSAFMHNLCVALLMTGSQIVL
jgi:hypothetical protein